MKMKNLFILILLVLWGSTAFGNNYQGNLSIKFKSPDFIGHKNVTIFTLTIDKEKIDILLGSEFGDEYSNIFFLKPGRHTVKISGPEIRTWKKRIYIRKNKTFNIKKIKFKAKPYLIKIDVKTKKVKPKIYLISTDIIKLGQEIFKKENNEIDIKKFKTWVKKIISKARGYRWKKVLIIDPGKKNASLPEGRIKKTKSPWKYYIFIKKLRIKKKKVSEKIYKNLKDNILLTTAAKHEFKNFNFNSALSGNLYKKIIRNTPYFFEIIEDKFHDQLSDTVQLIFESKDFLSKKKNVIVKWDNGNIKKKTLYFNDKKHGFEEEFYSNGKIKEKFFYNNGEKICNKNNSCISYRYYKNGMMLKHIIYKDNSLKNIEYKFFSLDGKLWEEGNIIDGINNSIIKFSNKNLIDIKLTNILKLKGDAFLGEDEKSYKCSILRKTLKGISSIKKLTLTLSERKINYFFNTSGYISHIKKYEKNKLMESVLYKKRYRDGIYKKFFENGKVEEEITYKKGRKNGLSYYYLKSGILKSKISFVNNIHHGTEYIYYTNGNLKEKTQINNNKPVIIEKFYEGGRIQEKTVYSWIIWQGDIIEAAKETLKFHENGKLKLNEEYKEGLKNGIFKEYNTEGKLIKKTVYKEGKEIKN